MGLTDDADQLTQSPPVAARRSGALVDERPDGVGEYAVRKLPKRSRSGNAKGRTRARDTSATGPDTLGRAGTVRAWWGRAGHYSQMPCGGPRTLASTAVRLQWCAQFAASQTPVADEGLGGHTRVIEITGMLDSLRRVGDAPAQTDTSVSVVTSDGEMSIGRAPTGPSCPRFNAYRLLARSAGSPAVIRPEGLSGDRVTSLVEEATQAGDGQ